MQVYVSWSQGPAANVELLEAMLEARHELAVLLGYHSYAAFRADDASLAGEENSHVDKTAMACQTCQLRACLPA